MCTFETVYAFVKHGTLVDVIVRMQVSYAFETD